MSMSCSNDGHQPIQRGRVKSQKISFAPKVSGLLSGGDATYRLVANLDLPGAVAPHEVKHWAILAHCFTCNRRSPGVARISKALAHAGIGALRLDFQGLGDSGGSFVGSSLSANICDIAGAADWLAEYASAPALIVGHSLGGAAALHAAAGLGDSAVNLKMVATVGAPFDPRSASVAALQETNELSSELTEFRVPGRDLVVGRGFLEDLASYTPDRSADSVAGLLKAGVALRIFHSPMDQTVAFRQARRFAEAAGITDGAYGQESSLSRLIPIDYADHLLTWPGSAPRVGQSIACEFLQLSSSIPAAERHGVR